MAYSRRAGGFLIGKTTLIFAFAAHLSRAHAYVPNVQYYQHLMTRQGLCTPDSIRMKSLSSTRQYCTDDDDGSTWRDVGSNELNSMMSNKDIQLIDVREPQELIEDGHIPISVNIPLGQVTEALKLSDEEFLNEYGVPKPSRDDSNIVFHCRSGIRSKTALEFAYQLGYSKARHYYPGYLGWKEFIEEQKI